MSYRSGFGGGYPSKKSAQSSKGYSMNAVPPPSSLGNVMDNAASRNFGKFQKAGVLSSINTASATPKPQNAIGLSKHGYSTMDSIAQFASSSQYALGKRKSKTEDE